jgi:hypothetical protein
MLLLFAERPEGIVGGELFARRDVASRRERDLVIHPDVGVASVVQIVFGRIVPLELDPAISAPDVATIRASAKLALLYDSGLFWFQDRVRPDGDDLASSDRSSCKRTTPMEG